MRVLPALGTRFLVNLVDKNVRVAVDHGRVEVQSIDATGNKLFVPIILTNGQMAEIKPSLAPNKIAGNALDAFAFTQGRLVFDDATLNEGS